MMWFIFVININNNNFGNKEKSHIFMNSVVGSDIIVSMEKYFNIKF